MKIVIKIGSAVLASEKEFKVDEGVFLNIAEQIKRLKEQEHSVVVVTSGAIASCKNGRYSRALRAAIGQPRLMSLYDDVFDGYGIEICQLLFTHDDLEGKRYQYTRDLLFECLENGVIPIINANDAVSSEELDALKQYADNDVLAQRVALLIGADMVLILTDQKGLVDFDSGEVIGEVSDENGLDGVLKFLVSDRKSTLGQGGMASKIKVAQSLRFNNIEVRILPGKQENAIIDSLSGHKIGTIFKLKKRP